MIREELILLSSLAWYNNPKGVLNIRHKFPFNDVVSIIEAGTVSSTICSGLIRIILECYIECKENIEYAPRKAYRYDDFSKNYPPAAMTELSKEEIKYVWTIIQRNLTGNRIEKEDYLVLDTLYLTLDFFRYNLIWMLDNKPLEECLHLLFNILLEIERLSAKFHSMSKYRMQKISIIEDPNISIYSTFYFFRYCSSTCY